MSVSGSITKTGSTTTSISVSWNITSTASNPGAIIELQVYGPGITFVDITSSTDKPIVGSGTVSGLSPGTSYTFGFGGQDKLGQFGNGSYSFSTDAAPSNPPVWTDNTLGGFQAEVAYSDSVSATNSPTYSLTAGALPTGISRSGGALSGTPTVAGQSYSFTLQAANGDGSVSQAFSGTVAAAPTAGKWRVWTGSTWVVGPVKVWNGSAWVAGSVKVWNGTAWVSSV
jgi:hypothetical protein